MLAFDPTVLGDVVMRNLALAKYDKPTPVQKYSIPIGAWCSCTRQRAVLCRAVACALTCCLRVDGLSALCGVRLRLQACRTAT
jgi:hypothetical protein